MSETEFGKTVKDTLEGLGFLVLRLHSGATKGRSGSWMQHNRKGTVDWCIVAPRGRAGMLELKVDGGRISEAQQAFADRCARANIPHRFASSLPEVVAFAMSLTD